MRYTLELKDKQVKESELVGEAEKVRRGKAAEAAGNEQIIAAKAQEEAMKHGLPFLNRSRSNSASSRPKPRKGRGSNRLKLPPRRGALRPPARPIPAVSWLKPMPTGWK